MPPSADLEDSGFVSSCQPSQGGSSRYTNTSRATSISFGFRPFFCGLSGTPDLDIEDIEDGESEVKMQDLKEGSKGRI